MARTAGPHRCSKAAFRASSSPPHHTAHLVCDPLPPLPHSLQRHVLAATVMGRHIVRVSQAGLRHIHGKVEQALHVAPRLHEEPAVVRRTTAQHFSTALQHSTAQHPPGHVQPSGAPDLCGAHGFRVLHLEELRSKNWEGMRSAMIELTKKGSRKARRHAQPTHARPEGKAWIMARPAEHAFAIHECMVSLS